MGSDNDRLLANGLPDMSAEERDAGSAKTKRTLAIMMCAVPAIGLGLAAAVDAAIGHNSDQLDAMGVNNTHYTFLTAWVFSLGVVFLNMYPMVWKSRVMRGKSGNLRANMYIFKQAGDGAPANAVVLDTDADAGSYNRANRSLHHFTENMAGFLVTFYLDSQIWPVATFVITLLYVAGRILHQVGYANKGYGGHGAGFGVAVLTQAILSGFCLLAFIKAN